MCPQPTLWRVRKSDTVNSPDAHLSALANPFEGSQTDTIRLRTSGLCIYAR